MIIIIEKLTKTFYFYPFVMKTQEVVTRKRENVGRETKGWMDVDDDGLSVGWMVFLCVVYFGEKQCGDMKGWLVAFNDFIYFYLLLFQCFGISVLIFWFYFSFLFCFFFLFTFGIMLLYKC